MNVRRLMNFVTSGASVLRDPLKMEMKHTNCDESSTIGSPVILWVDSQASLAW